MITFGQNTTAAPPSASETKEAAGAGSGAGSETKTPAPIAHAAGNLPPAATNPQSPPGGADTALPNSRKKRDVGSPSVTSKPGDVEGQPNPKVVASPPQTTLRSVRKVHELLACSVQMSETRESVCVSLCVCLSCQPACLSACQPFLSLCGCVSV